MKIREYFYIDIDLRDMKIVDWGVSSTASHDGKTDDPNVHRIFVSKGQFHKFTKHLE